MSAGPAPAGARTRAHAIEVRLANRPGALYRVLGIIGRHGGNIDRLVVMPAEDAVTSRARLVVRASDIAPLLRQMRRLLPVIGAELLLDGAASTAELSRLTSTGPEAHARGSIDTHLEEL